jgi:hypothetical protein
VGTARWAVALAGLIGPALLAAWPRGRARLEAESPRGVVEGLTVAVSVVFAVVVAFKGHSITTGLEILAGFALLAAGLTTWLWRGALRTAVWVILLVVAAVLAVAPADVQPVAKWLVIAVAWLPALGWAKAVWVRERWRAAGVDVDYVVTGQTWIAGLVTAAAIGLHPASVEHVAWFTGAALVTLLGARWGFAAMVEVASGLLVAGLGQAVLLVAQRSPEIVNLDVGFAAVAAVAVMALVLARFLPQGKLWASTTAWDAKAWLFPAAGLALVFALMYAQTGELHPYVTVGWGAAALAWFGFGLFARSRPDRLIGLVGVALCIPRMFMVDLHSTLHRIAAFGALGAVLLWVGFSYHRFRHLIADDTRSPDHDPYKKL